MPTTYKVTVTLNNGTLLTYTSVGAVTETATEKTFTGRRSGEATDGSITIHKDKLVDQKIEPV